MSSTARRVRRRACSRRSRRGVRQRPVYDESRASTRSARAHTGGRLMVDRLKGKVALVTGAGSQGTTMGNGKATATLFAREGARGVCVDQMVERAAEAVASIKAEGGTAIAVAADVTKPGDCEQMVTTAIERYGKLDLLHNNAGR